jgi:hypothetical protein
MNNSTVKAQTIIPEMHPEPAGIAYGRSVNTSTSRQDISGCWTASLFSALEFDSGDPIAAVSYG